MSLKVWLPLNGNANNQGLIGNLTQTNALSYVNGKMGKAMSTGGLSMTSQQAKEVFNAKEMSFCFWIYVSSDWTGGRVLFGNEGMAAPNNRKFTIFQYPNPDDLHLSWQTQASNGTDVLGIIYSDFFTLNAWTHTAITYEQQSKLVKLYKNGVLVQTYTCGTVYTDGENFANATQVITDTSIRYLNDFRIYDHCLSPKEVKEISKGLVLHYPLNNTYNCQPNKYSSPYCDGYMSGTGGFTRTALTNERGYNYKMIYTGTGNNAWKSLCVPNYSFTVGKKYYYSVKIRCNKWTGDSLYLRASRSNNDWVTNMVQVCSSGKADAQWHEYYTYQTVNETYDRSGSTVTCNPVLEFYTDGCATNGFVYDFDFDIKDVQVIESDQYVPFQEGQWNTNIVSDCSGFRNDGIITNTPVYYNISPRYFGCMNFNGAGYIKNDSFNISCKQETIAFWVKIPETITAQHFLFGTFNNWTGNGIGYWRDTGGKSYSGILKSDAESSYGSLGIPALTSGIWYHIAIVYTGTEAILYVNGAKYSSITYGKNGSIANPVCYLGNSKYNGCPASETDQSCVSDFRIYATALSADAVKQLYNTSISIDKLGNIYAYEYREV